MPSIAAGGVFLFHVFAVFAMTSVIWFVQLVTYPQFLEIGETRFPSYHASYTRRIAIIVLPLMLIELITAILAVRLFWDHEWNAWIITGSVLTLATWIITFSLQVPQHSALSQGYSEATVRSLVAGNWIRTILWSVHTLLALKLLWTFFSLRD